MWTCHRFAPTYVDVCALSFMCIHILYISLLQMLQVIALASHPRWCFQLHFIAHQDWKRQLQFQTIPNLYQLNIMYVSSTLHCVSAVEDTVDYFGTAASIVLYNT